MRTADGSLKLFPLHDVSMFSKKPYDSVRTANNWIGAIYYRIIQKSFNGKNMYTLLGYDDFTINSNKKWMDVLTFNEQGQPVFGGNYFSFKNDSAKASKKQIQRFYLEYKKEATTTFNYDSTLQMIVFDHLISESDEPDRKETYVPDGDYEGFVWENGQWLHVPKIFNTVLQEGQFPQEQKILNDAGGINEELLKQQSEKNKKKQNKQSMRSIEYRSMGNMRSAGMFSGDNLLPILSHFSYFYTTYTCLTHPVSTQPETLPAELLHFLSAACVSFLLSVFPAVFVYG